MPKPLQDNITRLGSIRQKQIFNRLNALHYLGDPFLVCLQHKSHDRCIYLKAHPDPVAREEATATWLKDDAFPESLHRFTLEKIILTSGRDNYEFKPEDYHFADQGIRFNVPDSAVKSGTRKQQRFSCIAKNIPITLTQEAIVFKGRLLDYSAHGILVDLNGEDDLSFAWLNSDHAAMLTIMPELDPVYTREVTITPRGKGQYLLFPNLGPAPRYSPKQFRARRQQLIPSPDVIFDHPITGKKFRQKIFDLSSLGFSIEEEWARASLMPGLLIRKAKISFANNLELSCVAQVVYFRQEDETSKKARIGLAILQIDARDHLNLINLVQQAQDPCSYVSSQINPADLFDFFFETGFLYPHKYAEIAARREEISQSYLALYEKGVDVSRHFVYQNSGQILGHFSTLQVYRKTWLSQHHAALQGQRAGLRVVRGISEYMNDSYRLNPNNIQYIIGYYQDSNRFPRKYFGDYVAQLKDPKKTSLDHFSYVKEACRFSEGPEELPQGWEFELAKASDIVEFYDYYQATASGLLPDALDLDPFSFDDQSLAETFAENGLVRQRQLYALRSEGIPRVLVDVQNSDFGLNLSEITNSITVYLIDPSPDYFAVISFAIFRLAEQKQKQSDPVMVYPNNYLSLCGFQADKEYIMWTLNIPDGMESYMAWMNKYCR